MLDEYERLECCEGCGVLTPPHLLSEINGLSACTDCIDHLYDQEEVA